MARTIEEIKKELVDNYVKQEVVKSKYGLTSSETINKISIENVLFYAVAFAIWVMEKFVEKEKAEIENIVNTKMYGTLGWWREKVLAWQCGDATTVVNGTVGYNVVDAKKRLIKHVAVQAEDRRIDIKVAKEENKELKPLSEAERLMLEAYVEEIKPAGLISYVISQAADELTLKLSVFYNGEMSSDAVKNGVKLAVNEYLASVQFDGSIYRTKLIDAVQAINGISDCEIVEFTAIGHDGESKKVGRTYLPLSGYFAIKTLMIDLIAE